MTFATFADALASRAEDVLDRCTACGKCFEVCPTVAPAGLSEEQGPTVTAAVRNLIAGGPGSSAARQWAAVCTGSGACIPACPESVNPRLMLVLARLAVAKDTHVGEQRKAGAAAFKRMTRGVRVLSRMQLTPDALARFSHGQDEPGPFDVVFYTGCNLLKTPHIGLLCFDILERLGVSYRVQGGPQDCCGIAQLRSGDTAIGGQVSYRTTDRFAAARPKLVLAWCPTCQIQMGETVLPNRKADDPEAFGFDMVPFVVWLADNLDRLRPHLGHPVNKRVALHEHPGVAGVSEAAERILRAVPGLEFVDLAQPRIGYMCNTLHTIPAYKRDLHKGLLKAAQDAGVEVLAGVYHACHRDLCSHERDWPLSVVNFLEIVGESIGLDYEDHFKRLKKMQDVDAIIADVSELALSNGLNLDEVREVILQDMLGEQTLELRS